MSHALPLMHLWSRRLGSFRGFHVEAHTVVCDGVWWSLGHEIWRHKRRRKNKLGLLLMFTPFFSSNLCWRKQSCWQTMCFVFGGENWFRQKTTKRKMQNTKIESWPQVWCHLSPKQIRHNLENIGRFGLFHNKWKEFECSRTRKVWHQFRSTNIPKANVWGQHANEKEQPRSCLCPLLCSH